MHVGWGSSGVSMVVLFSGDVPLFMEGGLSFSGVPGPYFSGDLRLSVTTNNGVSILVPLLEHGRDVVHSTGSPPSPSTVNRLPFVGTFGSHKWWGHLPFGGRYTTKPVPGCSSRYRCFGLYQLYVFSFRGFRVSWYRGPFFFGISRVGGC